MAALALVAFAGCQNNAERDLIARDRRMQEDHLYAMEDYISQYQQLVRKYRSQNESLRRELNEGRDGAVESEAMPMPRTPGSRPATGNGPRIENTPTPNRAPQMPDTNLEGPDVPPLNQSSWEDRDRYQTPASNVLAASHDEPIANGETASAAGKHPIEETAPDILLSGEVIANESGGGPRLVIDIEPFDRSGHIARFEGDISLALVAKNEDGRSEKLARWDFGPDEVRLSMDAASSEPTLRFHVELPSDTKLSDATEIWARLTPARGGRLLSHAKVDLSRPGVFSSRTDKIWASEEAVVAASYVETSPVSIDTPAEIATTLKESNWATALPGKPAILPPETDQAGGGWKASSEIVPVVATSTSPVASKRNELRPRPDSSSKNVAKAESAKKPAWTPERAGQPAQAKRPTWAASR